MCVPGTYGEDEESPETWGRGGGGVGDGPPPSTHPLKVPGPEGLRDTVPEYGGGSRSVRRSVVSTKTSTNGTWGCS